MISKKIVVRFLINLINFSITLRDYFLISTKIMSDNVSYKRELSVVMFSDT